MAYSRAKSDESRLTMAFLSKTGHGKSSLGNALFGEEVFEVSRRMSSATTECKSVIGMAAGRPVKVVDTPGTMDTRKPKEALQELCHVVTLCSTGVDAFLLVLRCDVRFTAEEQMTFTLLEKMFGLEVYKFCILVVSRGDIYDNDEGEFKKDLDSNRRELSFLSQLLDKCGNRFILMDNGPKCDKELQKQQVDKLMGMVEELASKNASMYSNRYFEVAQEKLKEEERREAERAAEQRRKLEDAERTARQLENTRQMLTDDAQKQAELQRQLEAARQRENELKTKQLQEEAERNNRVAVEVRQEVEKEVDEICFPSDATVQTPQGRLRLSELSLGQPVLAMQDDRPAFSPVFMWGHRDEAAWSSDFVTLSTESARLTLSADHLVFATEAAVKSAEARLVAVPARSVRPGLALQLLDSADDAEKPPRLETVIAVERGVTRQGLLAPFTLSGCIVVDGVLASCYFDRLPHGLSHVLLSPVRALWLLAPSVANAFNRVSADNGGMPAWVRLSCRRLLPALSWLQVDGSELLKPIRAD